MNMKFGTEYGCEWGSSTSQLQLNNNMGIKYHRMLILMGIEATISYAAVPENGIY